MEKTTPEMSIKAGSVTAAIWKNNNGKGDYFTVSLKRDYKDGDEWKSSSSLRVNDLPKATVALQKAYEFIILGKSA